MVVIGKDIMRLGIASPIDISVFIPFFDDEIDKEWINNNADVNCAPAVFTLCLSYLKKGCFLRIFTLAKEEKQLISKQVEIYTIPKNQKYPIKYLWGAWLDAQNIKKTIAKHISDLDAVHAHWTYDYAYAAAAFADKIPVICTVRDWAPYIWSVVPLKDKITWAFRYFLSKKVLASKNVHFVANSPYTAKLLENNLKKSVITIPNSVKISMICATEHMFPDYLKIITISSWNDKRKNIISLIKAYSIVLKSYPNAELEVICPQLAENSEFVAKWRKAGLIKGRIHFRGKVEHDRLKDYLDQSSVMVCPSLEESFGNTLLEGFSREIPVIGGANSGAVPYVLKHGKIGYLCDVKSPESIAKQIIYVYEHQSEAIEKTKMAKQILLEEFSESVVAQKYLDYIHKLKNRGDL